MRDKSARINVFRGFLCYFGVAAVFAFLALVLSGYSQRAAASPASVRIVVEFSESVSNPEAPDFIDELSDYAGASLSYVRALPSGGHVLRVNRVVNNEHLERVLKQLSRRNEVVYAKKDGHAYSRPASIRETLW